MNEAFDRGSAQASDTDQGIKQQITEKYEQAKETAKDFRNTAVQTINAQRETTAGALDRAAGAIHEQSDNLSRKTAGAGHATADVLDRVAGYIRFHDAEAMVEDVRGIVRRHPGQFLAGAAVVGFLVGRSLRRDTA